MDKGTLGAISTVLVTIAFFGVCIWAFSFADEPKEKQPQQQAQQTDEKQIDDRK